MTATATTNGKPQRKQLADQLDRLDGIIDALADGLNQAVIDAAREGTRLSVKDAIVEIMTNPELRALLAPVGPEPTPVPVTPPEPVTPGPKKPGPWTRLKAKVAAAQDAVTGAATRAKEAVSARYKAASDTVVAVGTAAGEALPLGRIVVRAAVAGLVVGVVCLVMPQTAAAAVSAVSVAATTVAVQTGSWLKRVARRFGLVN
ncbi:MAG: hypothetical protein ACKODX_09010 [Gemmata sp.]